MKSLTTITVLLAVTFLMSAGGCRRQNSAMDKSKRPTADSPYLKVYVTKSGEVTVDGKTATIDELEVALAGLAQRHGVVLYAREPPEEKEIHPMVKRVLDVVIKKRLPIRFCVKSDCSDGLTPDGKLRVEQ